VPTGDGLSAIDGSTIADLDCGLAIGDWLEAGSWKLEAGSWKLEAISSSLP
jgi:hypothetical protein